MDAKRVRFDDLPLFMSPAELAEYTGKHVGSIRRDIENGTLPADKIGGKWVICRDLAFPNTLKAVSGCGTQS